MKKPQKLLLLALAALLCLNLAACGDDIYAGPAPDPKVIVGGDWCAAGVVRDGGDITRGGETTPVLVCVHAEDAAFYLDEEVQTLYGFVEYPFALQHPWEKFQSIAFADRNGDGSSDVAMMFHVGGGTVLMVWFWDADADAYVFRPEESSVLPGEEK